MIDDISRFMMENKGEVIILELGNFADSHREEQRMLLEMLSKSLGEYFAPVYPGGLSSITVGEMVQRNERVVLMLPYYIEIANETDRYPYLWKTENTTEGEYANTDKLEKMMEWNKKSIYSLGGRGKLMSLSWTLTTQPYDIERAIIDPVWKIKSLRDLSHTAHPFLPVFHNKYSNFHIGNLLLVDWFHETDVVLIALERNARSCYNTARYHAISKNGEDCRTWALAGNCENETTELFMSIHCQLSCGLC
eukprot:TRINITY_DN1532_c0_g1_i2.p1 TRINITY_DN1532_c0_g1~~TRINITY_DN1532_c0_g1_i2.p1  ORF type:complete len:250 (+),score=40.73 TRINITY_DN1532_c0_g1_i2:447-1196(+)